MTTQEMRELDGEIAVLVFGYVWTAHQNPTKQFANKRWLLSPTQFADLIGCGWKKATGKEDLLNDCFAGDWAKNVSRYTTDPAAAMMVLEKCADFISGSNDIEICKRFGVWNVSQWSKFKIEEEALTLPLAICLFAKKLFTK